MSDDTGQPRGDGARPVDETGRPAAVEATETARPQAAVPTGPALNGPAPEHQLNGAPQFAPPSYGSSSFGPAAFPAAVSSSYGASSSSPAGPAADDSSQSALGAVPAGSSAARSFDRADRAPVLPAAGTLAATPDDSTAEHSPVFGESGAADWREAWRAAREGVPSTDVPGRIEAGASVESGQRAAIVEPADASAGTANVGAGDAVTGNDRSPTAAAPAAGSGSLRAALTAGLARAKALGTGSDATASSSPAPSTAAGAGGAAGAVAAASGLAAGAAASVSTDRSAATTVLPRRSPQPVLDRDRQAAPTPAARPAPRASSGRRPARRIRRAHLKLTRVDPWTVMKVSFMLSIAFAIMTVVAVAVVWSMLDAAGVFESLDETVQTVTGEGGGALGFDLLSWVGFDRVLGFATLIAVVDIVLITALATLGAFLYNLAASLLGGIEVTFVEDNL